MNRKYNQIAANIGRALAACALLPLAGGLGGRLGAAPFWDANTPGYVSWYPEAAGSLQAKDGTLFGITSAQGQGDALAVKWTKCGGWQNIGTFGWDNPAGDPALVGATFLIGNTLYVGGLFTSVVDSRGVTVTATNIAKYDISQDAWSVVGDNHLTDNPQYDRVQAVAVDAQGQVYAGLIGQGLPPGQLDERLLRVWNGTVWAPLGGGLLAPSNVRYYNGLTALATDGTNVYVGGNFDGSATVSSPTLIKWTGTQWAAMDNPFAYYPGDAQPFDPLISSLAISGTNLFVAGDFTGPYDGSSGMYTAPIGVARFSTGGSYIPTPELLKSNGSQPPVPGVGHSLTVLNGQVYLTGDFDLIGSVTNEYISQWNGVQWQPLGLGLNGVGNSVAAATNYIAVSGLFDHAGGSLCFNGDAARWVLSPESSQCEILDVDLGPSNGSKVGWAATGLTVNDYWNPYVFPNQFSVTITNLLWSDRSASGVNMTVSNAPGQWVNTTGDIMYDSFIYPWNGGSVTVTLANLPDGGYDLYCYGHSQLARDNTRFTASTSTLTSNTEATQDSQLAATSSNWVEGVQYVVLRATPVHDGQSLTITAARGDGTAIFNGFQIVPSRARLMDINLGPPPSGYPKVGFAATGLTGADYWNPYIFPNQFSVTVSNLLWSDQSSSAVNMTVLNAPGQWYNSTGDAMYDSFIYPWNGGSVTVILTNLPAGNYYFYCYGHSQLHEDNTAFQITSGGYSSPVEKTTDSQLAASSDIWAEGLQYVVFRNVAVAGGQSVTISAAPGDGVAILNGIQILKLAP